MGWLGQHPAAPMIRYNILVPEERNPGKIFVFNMFRNSFKILKELRLSFELNS
jgi:hypothetical protein